MAESVINITQTVAILVDGNNIERSLTTLTGKEGAMLNFDKAIPRLLKTRGLKRLIYFREGKRISSKLEERLHDNYYGSVIPCHKSADIPLCIKATQLASKVDTIIIMSGDSDYIELVKHLQGEGVRVEIAAIENNTSGDLKESSDYFHPITEQDLFIYVGAKGGRSSSKKKASRLTRPQNKTSK
jgi:uncharacterized LabA/DUF88 family protein